MGEQIKSKSFKCKRIIAIGNFILLAVIFSACGGKKQNNVNVSSITMMDVVGLQYDEAIEQMKVAGVTNISSNIDDYQDEDKSKIIIVSQKPSAGTNVPKDREVEIVCKKLCRLYLNLESKNNLLFKKYDIDIFFDGEKIGTVSNGKLYTKLMEVVEGKHTLELYNAEKNSVKKSEIINIDKDITFSALLSHGSNIDFDKNFIKDGVAEAEAEMPSVEGKILSKGEYELEKLGFININTVSNDEIKDKNDWMIIKQNVEEGKIIEKNEEIELECVSLEEFFKDCCLGKSMKEIEDISNDKKFNVFYLDKNYNLLYIVNISEEEKEEYFAVEVGQYTDSYNTAIVVVNSELSTANENNEENDETQKDAVYYSTNNSEDAKNGNKGVYAYKKSGSYTIYYIIDMDKGYVYYFTDGNGEESCMKAKIEKGTLNEVVIITYHDGNDSWSQGLHFKWKNQAENLVVQEADGFENEFKATDLEKALKLRDALKIIDY